MKSFALCVFCFFVQWSWAQPIKEKGQKAEAECEWSYLLIDEFSGKTKKALKSSLFFAYTPDAQRRFFPDSDYISCKANLEQNEAQQLVLRFQITVQERDAEKEIGSLAAGSNIQIRSLQGKTIYLTCYQGASAEKRDGVTVYECSFSVSKSDAAKLKKMELDWVQINWTKGFQIYEVFDVDFLKRQLECIDLKI